MLSSRSVLEIMFGLRRDLVGVFLAKHPDASHNKMIGLKAIGVELNGEFWSTHVHGCGVRFELKHYIIDIERIDRPTDTVSEDELETFCDSFWTTDQKQHLDDVRSQLVEKCGGLQLSSKIDTDAAGA